MSLPPRLWADHWVRAAAVVWVVLAVLSVGRAGLAHLDRHAGCYAVFADAGRYWLAGEDLYEKVHTYSLVVYRYSPTVAVLLSPLGVLPLHAGNGLLRLTTLAAFLGGAWWWQRVSLPSAATARHRAVFFLLVAAVSNNYLMDVQVNLFVAGLLLATAAAAATGRWWTAAAAVGLAVVTKGYPVSLALVLCLLAPRQFAWRWVVAQAGWFALPFVAQEPGYVARQYVDWVTFGLNTRFVDEWFLDAMYLAGRLGVRVSRADYQLAEVAAAAVVAGLALVHARRRPGLPPWNTAYALCLVWMLPLGPAAEAVTYVLAATAVAGAAFLAWYHPNPTWFRAALSAAVFLLAATQLELLFPGPHRFRVNGANPAALLLFSLAVGVRGFGYPRESAPAVPVGQPVADPTARRAA